MGPPVQGINKYLLRFIIIMFQNSLKLIVVHQKQKQSFLLVYVSRPSQYHQTRKEGFCLLKMQPVRVLPLHSTNTKYCHKALFRSKVKASNQTKSSDIKKAAATVFTFLTDILHMFQFSSIALNVAIHIRNYKARQVSAL